MSEGSDRPPAEGPRKTIGRYEIRKEIGRGMMGVVYQAHDPTLGRTVALKTISLAFAVSDEDRNTFEKRFLAEARAAAGMSHPGIVVVYEVGTDSETRTLYMALEYLRGTTLEVLLRHGALQWRDVCQLTARVAEALQHAHGQGIIHRDIKPSNIMVLEAGPKIMDFGVAKIPASELTTGGMVFGSPSYMSPEQAFGEAIDVRSDVFSLGSVLYELLTATKAFPGQDIRSVVMRLSSEDPAPPSGFGTGIPADLDYVVSRCLAKSRADRYPSAKALAEDLQDVAVGQAPRHRRDSTPTPPERETMVTNAASPDLPRPAPAIHLAEATSRASSGGPSLALPTGKRVSLAILTGPRKGEVFILDRPRTVIGREGGRANAAIEVPDPEMSRAHAIVESHGSRIVLRDLDSTNGTFVGTERISECALESHGEFRVGHTQFMVILADSE